MDWVGVALGGLGGSLVGSVVAYVGARRIQDRAIRRRERGVARAVYYEVARIASDLTIAAESRLAMPIVSTDTYDRSVGDLAQFLPPRDFDKVGFAYYSIHLYMWHAPAGTRDLPDLPEIVRRFAEARDVLERAAFTPEEMRARRAPDR